MKVFFFIMIITFFMEYTFEFLFCPKSNKAPKKIAINTSYTINPIIYNNESYTAVNVGNKIFLNRFKGRISTATTGTYSDSEFCPKGFKIPLKEDFESVIEQLGKDAYSVLTDPNGFNMEPGVNYLTNTKGQGDFTKIMMYLEDKKIKFRDTTPFGDTVCRCLLVIYPIKLNYSNIKGEINMNQKTILTIDSNILNGYLWKIGKNIYKTKSIEYKFTKSGMHPIEFWGNFINGETIYYCDYVFVKKLAVSSSQEYDDSKVKTIETNFKMAYNPMIHFQYSNSPVAPRIDGGYYISFTDEIKFLHILSYDKDNNLIKDFNTTERAYPFDITATDYGFAIYLLDGDDNNHSYLSLYNKKFKLVNKIQIMNNYANDNSKNSNISKQISRYDKSGTPVFGMESMYQPQSGKLKYSRGRIFLIFSHYNYFPTQGSHTGDTTVTFNDVLQDMDFGSTWGTSHSLIQSGTFDEYYFWTAALGDASPEGILAIYTSKADIHNDNAYYYDPINKKYNLRYFGQYSNLAGYIKGDRNGHADGKLGGILYFEKYKLYCLIYAKIPNNSTEEKNGKNIIYITTWKFELSNKTFSDIKTIEVKVFENETIMQVRAGKYGDDKVFIIYTEKPKNSKDFGWGYLDMGTIPYLYVIDIITLKKIKDNIKLDKLIMNTNEDLKTFNDGVLIWASTNKEGKLIIHKVGTPLLNEKYDDINYILTKDDLNEAKGDDENNSNFSAIIIIVVIIVILLLILAVYILIRRLYSKKTSEDIISLTQDTFIN